MNETELIILAQLVESKYELEKFTSDKIVSYLGVLEQTKKDILLKFDEMTNNQQSRAKTLLEIVDKDVAGLKTYISTNLSETAGEVSHESAKTYWTTLSFSGKAAEISAVALSPAIMTSLWNTVPVGGQVLSTWVDKTFDAGMKDHLRAGIAKGLINAESYAQVKKGLDGAFDISGHHLETLVKTYMHSANMDALKRTYEANKDIIKRVRWCAAFEGGAGGGRGTCLRCAWLDGKTWKLGEEPPCPIHPRCRCVLSPVTDQGSMGLSNKDFQSIARPYTVWNDGSVTKGKLKLLDAGRWNGDFEGWLKAQPENVLKNMVGPTRFQLMKEGKLEFKDLVDPSTYEIKRLHELKPKPGGSSSSSPAEQKITKAKEDKLEQKKKEFSESIKAGMAAKKEALMKAAKEEARKEAKKAFSEALGASMKESAGKVSSGILKAAKEAAELAAKEAAKEALEASMKKAATDAAGAIQKAAVLREEAATIKKLKKEYIDAVTNGSGKVSDDLLEVWIDHSTKEDLNALEAAMAAKDAAEKAAAAKAAAKKELGKKISEGMAKTKAKKLAEKANEAYKAKLVAEQAAIQAAKKADDVDDVLKSLEKDYEDALQELGHAQDEHDMGLLHVNDLKVSLAKYKAAGKALEDYKKGMSGGVIKQAVTKEAVKDAVDSTINEVVKDAVKDIDTQSIPISEKAFPEPLVSVSGKQGNITLDGDKFVKYGSQQGSNEGGFYHLKEDASQRYYFKFLKSEDHIDNEILAGKLYERAGIDAVAKLNDVKMGGRRGLASKIIEDLEQDGDALMKGSLNDAIKRDMAIDAWIGNWDVVGMGFDNLKIKNGKAYRVDVGGSLLYRAQGGLKGAAFGAEVKELETFLDQGLNPYSAKVFDGITREQIVAGVRKVIMISDEEIHELVKQFGPKGEDGKGLAETLIARKNWLAQKYPEAAKDTVKVKAKKVKDDTAKIVTPADKTATPKIVDEKFIREVDALGYQGKTLPFDEDLIEDQNALVFVENFNGTQRTVIQMKTRPSSDKKVIDAIKKNSGGFIEKAVPAGNTSADFLDIDIQFGYGDKIEAAAKNIAYHGAVEGKVNQAKLSNMLDIKPSLQNYVNAGTSEQAKMAKYYLAEIEKLEESLKSGVVNKDHFKKYVPPKKAPKQAAVKEKDSLFKVKEDQVRSTKRVINDGRLTVYDDDAAIADFFPGNEYSINQKPGRQYTMKFEDGTRARYIPWSNDNFYAHSGKLEIVLHEAPTPETIKKAFEKIEELGIKAKVADALDAEKMYLEKLAYIRKDHKHQDYRKLIADLEAKKATTEERVIALRKLMSEKVGVKDITQLAGYKPEGEYQLGFLDKSIKGGRRVQYRPDITSEELDREMKSHSLLHKLTNNRSLNEFLDIAMKHNGAAISTTEKIRLGIPAGGMSPAEDMNTGGASYFFTRIVDRKYQYVDGKTLILKKDMLRRADAISYWSDKYGRCTDSFVEENRMSTIEDWKNISGRDTNETIFKDSVMVLENVEYMVAADATDKQNSINTLLSYGFTHLPDGRKIEKVIVTPKEWQNIAKKS